MRKFDALAGLVTLALCLGVTSDSFADLVDTVPLDPGDTVIPPAIPAATPAGVLLAELTAPFSFTTTAGTTSGTFTTAVFAEPTGSLDFYYQVTNSARSATAIDRETDVSFAGFVTSVGDRSDGASLIGGAFVNGTATPVTSDRDAPGAVVGSTFNPPESGKISPGMSSQVFVICTNATQFAAGNATISDGGAETVAAFQPTTIPEPTVLTALVASALLAVQRRR